jgi:hypothetical protein
MGFMEGMRMGTMPFGKILLKPRAAFVCLMLTGGFLIDGESL